MKSIDKKTIIKIAAGILVTVVIIIVMLNINSIIRMFSDTNNTNSENTSEKSIEEMRDDVYEKLSDVNEKFSIISKEMLEDDKITIKAQYSDIQKNLFNALVFKITELGKAYESIEKMNEDENLKFSDYKDAVSSFSGIVNEIYELITQLDNNLHTNREEFDKVFKELSELFDRLKKEAVSEDGKLLDKYSEYQSEYENLIKEIVETLKEYTNKKTLDQEYYNGLTEKGKEIIEKINSFAKKAGIF